MSAFTHTNNNRLEKLKQVAKLILDTGNAKTFISENGDFIPTVIPSDFITLFDEIIKEGYRPEDMKILTSKVLNIFFVPIRDYKRIQPRPDSFLGILEKNNQEMEQVLNSIRPVFKDFVKDSENKDHKRKLIELFGRLQLFDKYYTLKENVLFPVLESTWPDYRCLQIMWSFQDDIRKNIKLVINLLSADKVEFSLINKCVGEIFFNMKTIKFRDERILFPHILDSIDEDQLESMIREGAGLGYPYFEPNLALENQNEPELNENIINLGTGKVSIEQIKLIFNHLPVDITFVDENNKVCYFSTPTKRIFPRTTAIIGREVSNCHPPESVHVVEQILESFRTGEKDQADFWIKMRGEFILIQYFAVRDESENYRGVIEVSQEISSIKALEGEKRLLDW